VGVEPVRLQGGHQRLDAAVGIDGEDHREEGDRHHERAEGPVLPLREISWEGRHDLKWIFKTVEGAGGGYNLGRVVGKPAGVQLLASITYQ
jgi:hypothetical protein